MTYYIYIDMEKFAHLIKTIGLSVTAQRIAVLNIVGEHPHITADKVVSLAKEQIGSISKQSVYDVLSVFSEKGIVRRIQPSKSSARFELRVNDNHHHMVCRTCGIVKDVDCAVGETPCLTPNVDHGFIVDEAEVIYWGICPKCQAAQRKSNDV